MPHTINIYCDESSHLENEEQPWMVLGALWCPQSATRESAVRIREIKRESGPRGSRPFELKWTKVSPGGVGLYRRVLDYFFDDDDLRFRAVVIDKRQLNHAAFGHDHDDWYYKMWYTVFQTIIAPGRKHRIYLDIKDTRSNEKVGHLKSVLRSQLADYDHSVVERVQQVRSHEVEHVQLADLLSGIVATANHESVQSPAKKQLVERMEQRSGISLQRNTLLRASKVNLLHWRGRGR